MASEAEVFTKLIDKQQSPLVLRKFTRWGFPVYVAIITDDSLEDFDKVTVEYLEEHAAKDWVNNIQRLRNLAGNLSDHLVKTYGKAEGVAVVFYVDKMFVSSLFGDFMNHLGCKFELYQMIGISAHI